MAWAIRFVNKSRTKDAKQKRELTPDEMQKAELVLVRQSQLESFAPEIQILKAGKKLKPSDPIFKLSPYLDETGVLRLSGRIRKMPGVAESTMRPAILDPKHPFTQLIIKDIHDKVGHNGHELVLNELRQKYWVINGKQAIRSVWQSCQVCKLRSAKPRIPEMGLLPDCRLHQPPFSFTGLDYFGPMDVTVGRRHEKRYGALFTCLTTRAIHIEVTHALNTDSCSMALRRFVSRRGCPQEVWSDNGTNFKGAERELMEALEELDQEKIERECCGKGITWKFIPPRAPHMGESWERMVKSVKIALQATLKTRAPKDELLLTLMPEAENLVNSHPLTHVSLDSDEDEALTPNHFLIGRSSGTPALGIFDDSDLHRRKQWRSAQRMTDLFWNRWLKEYVPTLMTNQMASTRIITESG